MQHPIHYATLLPLHRGNLGKHPRSPSDFFFFSQIIHTCGTLDTGMIAQLLVAQGNRHETFTVQKAKKKKCLRNIAARRNYQYNLVNAMENNAVKYAQFLSGTD